MSDGFCIDFLPSTWNISKNQPKKKSTVGSYSDMIFNFEVILVVDNMEVVGGSTGGKKSRKEVTLDELSAYDINYERKKLSIGDFVWIAKKGNEFHSRITFVNAGIPRNSRFR